VRKGTCKFYNGIANDNCDKGINYREITGGPTFGIGTRLPCVIEGKFSKPKNGEKATCEHFVKPTKKELDDWEESVDRSIKQVSMAIKTIGKTGKQNGVIQCPACNGKLGFSVSPGNGHIWAKCETNNCLAWMQ